MLLVFTLIGLVLIGFVTYGFGVVNKLPTKIEGPIRENEVNKLTDQFNVKVQSLRTNYLNAKKLHGEDKEAIASLKKDVTGIYNGMREEYNSQVDAIKAPSEQKNPVRAFWNKVIYGGVLASLTCCFGSGCYVACSEEDEPQKLMGATSAWNAENIPMPHLQDESQYVANPDNVLSKETVDSMNIMLKKLDKELNIETAFAIVNHVEGEEAFRLAQDMGNKYGVGRNNRGLVVVMAYGDHDINISPGTDLESTLTDGKCGRLLDIYVIPFLKKNQPDSAMLYLTRALLEVLKEQDELSPVYEKPTSDEARDLGIMGGGTLGLWGLLALLRRKLDKKGLMEENFTPLRTVAPNPTIEIPRGLGAGAAYGSSRSRSSSSSSRSYRSSSSSSSSSSRSVSRGSYGGGHFGGGGASRKW